MSDTFIKHLEQILEKLLKPPDYRKALSSAQVLEYAQFFQKRAAVPNKLTSSLHILRWLFVELRRDNGQVTADVAAEFFRFFTVLAEELRKREGKDKAAFFSTITEYLLVFLPDHDTASKRLCADLHDLLRESWGLSWGRGMDMLKAELVNYLHLLVRGQLLDETQTNDCFRMIKSNVDELGKQNMPRMYEESFGRKVTMNRCKYTQYYHFKAKITSL